MGEVDFKSLGFPTQETYEFPNIVNVEVFRGACPCSCVHCPVGVTEQDDRHKRFGYKGMNLGLYEKIIREMTEHPHSTIRIHSAGEPLLWEDLVQAAELTHNRDVKSWIFTCAVTRDMSLLETICKNIDIIEVSVNSTTPEDYKATKGIDGFEIVIRNIEYMHEFIEGKGITTRLIASRVQSLDQAADEAFVRYWKESGLVHDAFVRTYHTYNDLMERINTINSGARHEPCLVHWARFSIAVDGRAVVCFNELFKQNMNPSLIYGDVNHQTITEIWHGPKLTALRRAELSGDYSGLSFGGALPCKDCYSCQPLFGNRVTSEHQIKQLK